MLWVHVSDQSYFFMSDHEEKWPDVYSVGHLSDIMSAGMSWLISIFSVCSFVKCSWLMMNGKMLFEERYTFLKSLPVSLQDDVWGAAAETSY